MDIYVVVGFSSEGELITRLQADNSCSKFPDVRAYNTPGRAKAFHTRAVNLRDKGDYHGHKYNTEAVDIKIAKVTFSSADIEWIR